MEDERFDRLIRALVDQATRRGVLGLLASLTGLGAGESLASRHHRPHGQDAPAAACRTLNQSCTPKPPKGPGKWRKCCARLVCLDKRCISDECPSFSRCGGVCVDLQTDPKHCGACNHACLQGERCLGSTCVSQCLAGLTACNGTCVDLQSDPAHCGTCDNACGLRLCQNGACGLESSRCVGGLTLCSGTCVDVLRDPTNCGTCGHQCFTDQPCLGGVCGCRGLSQKCTDSSQCCTNSAGVSCAIVTQKPTANPNEQCLLPINDPDPRYCCIGVGQPCGTSCECCGGLVCRGETLSNGFCQDALAPPCTPYGQPCGAPNACCNNVPCTGGLCRFN